MISLEVQGTNLFSPEHLMVELDFSACEYQVAVFRITPTGGEQARVQ